MKIYLIIANLGGCLAITACGSGAGSNVPAVPQPMDSSSSFSSNQIPLIVDRGSSNSGSYNVPYITLKVCIPNTNSCQIIDHVILDSGSQALRLTSAALPNANYYPAHLVNGSAVYTCTLFGSGYAFGQWREADIIIGNTIAKSIPFQILEDNSSATSIPYDCSSLAPAPINSNSKMKGIIGIRPTLNNSEQYYTCNSSCTHGGTLAVTSPFGKLAKNNNGAIFSLPSPPPNGNSQLQGTLTLGINTESNNQLDPSASIIKLNPSNGFFTTTYLTADPALTTNYDSLFDSGTNYVSFIDPENNLVLKLCSIYPNFYCPVAATLIHTIMTSQVDGAQSPFAYTILNASNYLSTAVANNALLPGAAGSCDSDCANFVKSLFIWGLPAFYGKTIYFKFIDYTTPPFMAIKDNP